MLIEAQRFEVSIMSVKIILFIDNKSVQPQSVSNERTNVYRGYKVTHK